MRCLVCGKTIRSPRSNNWKKFQLCFICYLEKFPAYKTKFHKNFANFKITKDKAKTRSTSNDKIKDVVKEIKTELEEKDSSGLMAKENS